MSYITKRRSKNSGIIPREIIADESTLMSWVSDHSRKLAFGFGAVVLVLALSLGFFWARERSARIAGEDLGAALRFFWSATAAVARGEAPDEPARLEQAIAKFQEVAGKHGGAVQGLTASMYMAGLYFELGRYQDAVRVLDEVKSADREVFTDLNGPLLLGRCQEALGEFGKALEVYSSLRDSASGDLEVLLTMDMARCGELLGDTQRAISLYREVKSLSPESAFASRAEKKLALLGVVDREEL